MAVILRTLIAGVVALTPAGASLLPAQSGDADDPVLLEVAGREFRLSEVLRSYEQRHRGHLSLLEGPGELQRLVERVRDQRLLVLEAEAQGLVDNPALKEMIADYERKLVRNRFIDELTTEDVAVTAEEVDQLRERLAVAYDVMEIGTPTRAAADRARQAVLRGQDFAVVAAEASVLPSRTRGGAVAPKRYDEFEPDVRKWVLTASEGSVSAPAIAQQGYKVYKLLGRRPAELPRRATIKTRLLSWLMREKVEQRQNELRGRLRKETRAEIVRPIQLDLFLSSTRTRGDEVIARAEGVEPVLVRDVRAILSLPKEVQQNPEMLAEVVRFAAWRILDDRLLDMEAFRSGAASDPEIVTQIADFRDDLAVKFMKSSLIYHDLEVKEERLQELYLERRAELAAPAEMELQHIVTPTREDALGAAAEISGGASFEDVARARSIDEATAPAGGKVGWVSSGTIHGELQSYAQQMKLGTVSPPIQTAAGWHLLRVLRRRPGKERSFEQVRDRLYEDEILRMRGVELDKWTALLRDRVEWRILEENLPAALEAVRRKIEEESVPALREESR